MSTTQSTPDPAVSDASSVEAQASESPVEAGEHRHHIVIVGGGNGGLSIAGRLQRAGVEDIAVIDPNLTHYYKPLFSHVAGGTAKGSEAQRPQRDLIPNGVQWVQDTVLSVDPGFGFVSLASGENVHYEQLILAPGIVNDWAAVPGLTEALGYPNVASNYEYDLAVKSSAILRDVRSGTVVFSQAPSPASCAGAAQKPMYQACAYWQALGVLENIRVVLLVPEDSLFGIPEITQELQGVVDRYGIEVRTLAELKSVDAENQTVTFGAADEQLHYDVLMVEPPQAPPAWIAASGLADSEGYIDVDPHTLQSSHHSNVWALGDAAGTKNYKSGGALRKQAKTLAENVVSALAGKTPASHYDGYGVCPFTVSRSTAVFAEFDEKGRLTPTLGRRSYQESRRSWIIDRYVFPKVYWNLILQGRA